ncbi:MAG: hypothetical protein LUF92_04975, partial [Clostridiales bacterium]|nr:hypothetical protein [Clostridiales bacterium]
TPRLLPIMLSRQISATLQVATKRDWSYTQDFFIRTFEERPPTVGSFPDKHADKKRYRIIIESIKIQEVLLYE